MPRSQELHAIDFQDFLLNWCLFAPFPHWTLSNYCCQGPTSRSPHNIAPATAPPRILLPLDSMGRSPSTCPHCHPPTRLELTSSDVRSISRIFPLETPCTHCTDPDILSKATLFADLPPLQNDFDFSHP